MYSSSSRHNSGQIGTILKVLMGFGILLITVALVLFFNQILSTVFPSFYLQLAIIGIIVMVMSFLSLRIFERL
ncbi:MAG: hypothetical protein KGI27_01545 [Thaumarchaeota archaeon]|nr:hypothetical protein [Nitrososphaerota archaeon]